MPDPDHWLLVKSAVGLIGRKRNVGPDAALSLLVEACSLGKVRSRYGVVARINPAEWPSLKIDLDYNGCTSSDFVGFRHIAVSEPDLNRWLARPRRGPKPGQLARYREADLALLPEIKRIMREKQVSATVAAEELVRAGKVAGVGSPASLAKRLARVFLAATEIR
jgi:hypothetical protein